MTFRRYVEPARNKRLAHIDFHAQMEKLESLGGFPNGADRQFFRDLEEFVTIAYEHICGTPVVLSLAMSHDTYRLITALEKAVLYDGCSICTATERAVALLDYEDRDRSS